MGELKCGGTETAECGGAEVLVVICIGMNEAIDRATLATSARPACKPGRDNWPENGQVVI